MFFLPQGAQRLGNMLFISSGRRDSPRHPSWSVSGGNPRLL